MAYVFKLPPTVTDQIMRFAIGYPSDRMRDIVNSVERIEYHTVPGGCLIEWRYNGTYIPGLMMVHIAPRWNDSFRRWKTRDEDRVKYYGDFCDACEPAELQLERTHF